MHILIDGYNLIRQTDLRRFEVISLEKGRRELVRRLALYKKARKHKITVVFDGIAGESFAEERDRSSGISIIYSRKGESADDVIKRAVRNHSEQLLVVTSDRGIALAVGRQGFSVVTSQAFAQKLQESELAYAGIEPEPGGNEDYPSRRDKKGPARRMPKRKRAGEKNLKRL